MRARLPSAILLLFFLLGAIARAIGGNGLSSTASDLASSAQAVAGSVTDPVLSQMPDSDKCAGLFNPRAASVVQYGQAVPGGVDFRPIQNFATDSSGISFADAARLAQMRVSGSSSSSIASAAGSSSSAAATTTGDHRRGRSLLERGLDLARGAGKALSQQVVAQVAGGGGSVVRSTDSINVSSASVRAGAFGAGSIALGPVEDAAAVEARVDRDTIRAAFLRFIVSLFKSYRSCIRLVSAPGEELGAGGKAELLKPLSPT